MLVRERVIHLKVRNSNNMLSLVTSCISHIVECHMSVDTFFRGEDPSRNSKCQLDSQTFTKKFQNSNNMLLTSYNLSLTKPVTLHVRTMLGPR